MVFFGESRQFPAAGSSLRSVTVLEDVLGESCGCDVEDGLVPEFDDNPRTERGTKFFVLHEKFIPCKSWPTHRYIRVLHRVFLVTELQARPRVIALSRRDQDRKHTCASSFVCTSPVAVTTTVRVLDLCRVSSASDLTSFFAQHVH